MSTSFADDILRRIEEEVESRVGEVLARSDAVKLRLRVAELEEELVVTAGEAARWQEVR